MKKGKFTKILAAVTATLVLAFSVPLLSFAAGPGPVGNNAIHVMQVPDDVVSVTINYDGNKNFTINGTTGSSPKFDGTYPADCTDKNINFIVLNWNNGATTKLDKPDLKISNDGNGTINVKIDKKDLKMPLAVTVNYYKGSVTNTGDADHFLGYSIIQDKDLHIGHKITLNGGTDPNELDYKRPAGYYDGKQQGNIPYVVVAGTNVINVLYTPCTQEFKVYYYKDTVTNPSAPNCLGHSHITAKTDDKVTLAAGTAENQLDYKKLADVKYGSGVQQGTVPYIVKAKDNVINVLYVKKELTITVKYYKDSVSDANLLGTGSLATTVHVGDPVTLVSGTASGQLDYKKPAVGYNSGAQQGTIPYVAIDGTNVINVVYMQTNLTVTVKYYKGSVADANLLGSSTYSTIAHVGDAITLAAGSAANQLDYKKPTTGYASGKQQGTVPYAVVVGTNVINVVYSAVLADVNPPITGPKTGDGMSVAAMAIGLLSMVALGGSAFAVKKHIGR